MASYQVSGDTLTLALGSERREHCRMLMPKQGMDVCERRHPPPDAGAAVCHAVLSTKIGSWRTEGGVWWTTTAVGERES